MEDLKKIHDDLYETLIEFDNFCNKFDIKYSLTSGTLIGAIRENGFIPRDDDIDIMMSREEYQKFLNIAAPYYNDNPDSKIKIETYTLDKNYTLFYGAFINISKEHPGYQNPKKFPKKYPNGVWLDIFPFDYINPSKILKGFYNFYIRTLTSSFAYKTFEVNSFPKFLKVAFSKFLPLKESSINLNKLDKLIKFVCGRTLFSLFLPINFSIPLTRSLIAPIFDKS